MDNRSSTRSAVINNRRRLVSAGRTRTQVRNQVARSLSRPPPHGSSGCRSAASNSTGVLPAAGKKSGCGGSGDSSGRRPIPQSEAGSRTLALVLARGSDPRGRGGAHKAPPPGAARPTRSRRSRSPRPAPSSTAAFDEGSARCGMVPSKEAPREPLTRATRNGAPFEAWHNLGVVGDGARQLRRGGRRDSSARSTSSRARARRAPAYGESLRRAKNGKKAGEVYARWLNSDSE